MDTQKSLATVILDDGHFYIELNCNCSTREAPGFLHRRCYVGVTSPGGYECVGSFERDVHGRWKASIDAVYNEATQSDCRSLGIHADRLDAITALWSGRRDAFCRHTE